MNDDDLRSRFDLLVEQLPPRPHAHLGVRAQATALRRRRRATAAGIVLVAAVAAAGGTLTLRQHTTSAAGVGAPVRLNRGCSSSQTTLASSYGTVQRLYGELTTAGAAAAWGGPGAAAFAAQPPAAAVDLCFVVGDLTGLPRAAGGQVMHYALDTTPAGLPGHFLYAEVDYGHLPESLMPGVDRAQVAAYAPTAAPHAPTPVSHVPTPVPVSTPGPATTATVLREAPARACSAKDLVGRLRYVGYPDGGVLGTVEVTNASPSRCMLHGDLSMTVLRGDGSVLPVPAGEPHGAPHGVNAVTPVSGVLLRAHAFEQGQDPDAQALEIGVDSDYGCPAADVATPAAFRLTIGTVVLTVANHDADAVEGEQAVSGCPYRFAVGSAELN